MSLIVRDAQPSDAEAIVGLVGVVQALHVAARPESFRQIPEPELAAWLDQASQNPAAKIWVAEMAGAVCGYLMTVERKQTPNPFVFDRIWLEVDQVCVLPAHRGAGVARALLETARAYAQAQGIRDVELCTWSFNEKAQRAFSKLGFVPKLVRFESKP